MVAVKGWFYTHLQRQSVPTHGFLRKWQDPKPPEKYALFSERSAHVSAPVAPVFNLTILTGNKVPKYEYRDTQKTTMPHQLCLITVFWPVMSPCSLISCAIREHSTSINDIISTCRMYTFIGRHYVILFVISFWGFGFCINFVKSTSCGLIFVPLFCPPACDLENEVRNSIPEVHLKEREVLRESGDA